MMAREFFRETKFQRRTLELIARANRVIEDYAAQGFVLTLRQLFYQCVARGYLDNTLSRYAALGWAISNGRDAGLIDWEAIEDRSREFRQPTTWKNPAAILADAAAQYKEDLWATQPRHIELWVERDPLAGVFAAVCADYRVPFLAHRGDASTTKMYEAGKRLAATLILHFTDHDPTGLDMRRDVENRLARYARQPIETRVLGLLREQIDQYEPPPNPAKETDPRYADYVRDHGPLCWELDALSPDVLNRLARGAIEDELDHCAWSRALTREQHSRKKLRGR
jgi:hypothetical protein